MVIPRGIMKCWVVSNGTNTGGHTGESVTNIVNGVNEIYSQVCLKFEIDSVSYTNDTRCRVRNPLPQNQHF